ncbi:MAG: ribosome-associated translation inhibitor RaiA [Anaerolineales bacterium]|nr:ribosome-associated translation inhibitor RaiA [Anaerolineales bacterium]
MTVTVTIHGRDVEVKPRLQEYVEKKVGKLDRYLATIHDARVDLTELKSARSASDRYVAQLTIPLKGTVLRAEERHNDVFAAVDAVLEKMNRQIERYKGKRFRGRGDGLDAAVVAADLEEEAATVLEGDEDTPTLVVRRKKFALTPMNEAEAIEQMQLLSHDNFFVFFNGETNRVNVLYRRRDGNLGLIDPDVG